MEAIFTATTTHYQRVYSRLRQFMSHEVAVYILCAVSNTPYFPGAEATNWKTYDMFLQENSIPDSEVQPTFENGVTDIELALTHGLTQEELWLENWGSGDEERSYTEKQYKRLDSLYKIMTGQLADIGSLTRQQEDTARFCAMCALQREELIAKGGKDNITMASNLDAMIRKNLEDCAMRTRDILPTQIQRIDGIVDALKRKYGLQMDMSYDEVMEAFRAWTKERDYPQTVDAEEHAIQAIINTMLQNNDQPQVVELPVRLRDFGCEFASRANEEEIAAIGYLGLSQDEQPT